MLSPMDSKLKKRKLDALRRGVHRIGAEQGLPFCVNLIGIGKAGADTVAEVLRSLPPTGQKLSVLVVDIGEGDLGGLREAAAALPPDRADVEIVALKVPGTPELLDTLHRYRDFLKLEYTMFHWTAKDAAWLPSSVKPPNPGAPVDRAYAKAVYGRAYYDGTRPLRAALRRFGARVEASRAQSMVAVVFGAGGGTGSGMVVDLARHLSNVVFGRQALTVGIGILPCDGDKPQHRDGSLFATLNELDCLGDETKNQGVVTACGELFRNPFTAGVILVPQQPAWVATGDLAKTQARISQEIGALLTARGGANLWETLRLLNWVAAPSTQHSAARTPWGAHWIHMLGFADMSAKSGKAKLPQPIGIDRHLPEQLGLLPSYKPEYVELRVASPEAPEAVAAAAKLGTVFAPDVAPQIATGGRPGSVQFILPSISKADLGLFYAARDAYDAETEGRRLLDHSLLLEQGVLLSEPSTRLEGMAGASLEGCDSWIAVPLKDLRGGEPARRETVRENA